MSQLFKLTHRIAMEETNMQAAVVPTKSGSWQFQDVPKPQPGPNQVLVKMHASGVCYTDVHETLGHIPGKFPRILGHEPVGEIVAVAPDVTTRKVGDRAAAGGADIVLSTSNSTQSMVDAIQGLRPDGRLVAMGADAEPLSISLMDLITKRIRIIGSQQNGPEYLYEALDFVARGKVKTIVETYPLVEAPKAYQRVVDGKARFRAVLTM